MADLKHPAPAKQLPASADHMGLYQKAYNQAARPPLPPPPGRTPTSATNFCRVSMMYGHDLVAGTKCVICWRVVKPKEAALCLQDFTVPGVSTRAMHRRCVEAIFDENPTDVDIEQARFVQYRQDLIERRGLTEVVA